MVSRTLYDIAQLLESADGADARVRRVLELLRALVPYEQCAILEAHPGHDPRVVMMPEAPSERLALTETLLDTFGQLIDANAPAPAARPQGPHLAVPLVGLDQVIGLLFVRSPVEIYTEEHVRALSVVAAKLAAYFTTLRARAELTALAGERDEARRAAEAANRAKDDFLALVSHELKAPLASIIACAEILRSPADDAARARASDELQRNVQAQTELIDDILQLACIVSATLRLDLRITEPADVIKATIERLRLAAEQKAVSLACNLDAAPMPLVIDPERIGQVVSILVASAIKFTPAGGKVEVSLDRAVGYARIRVRDGGSGIAAEALPHIFDPFRYAAGAGTHADGPGVGLAIVKDLVELHGGRVRAESAGPQRGATFTVELPHAAGPAPRRVLPGEAAGSQLLSGIRVLLVDHDPALRESFQLVLDDYGADVTAVGSAPEALAALERSRPDVLLFGDLARRDDSVYELMRDVTARSCPLPVASISAWRLERERELAAGFRLHLLKPLEMGTLVDAVLHLAGRPPGRAPRSRSWGLVSR